MADEGDDDDAAMSRRRRLEGGCSCGRNSYTVTIPRDSLRTTTATTTTTKLAQVVFDNSYAQRRSQATPLSAWLRVPLSWYRSSTHAFFEDEHPRSIRKTYSSPAEKHSQRHFCGFCGTPLTFWTENPSTEAEFILLTIGSLSAADLHDLEDLGLVPSDAEVTTAAAATGTDESNTRRSEGVPWFEAMVAGSPLGCLKQTWGERSAADGNYRTEWEITELTGATGDMESGESTPNVNKRKIDQLVQGDDSTMTHSH